MRPLQLVAVAVAVLFGRPVVAHADSFLEVTGGLSFPIDDSSWTDTTETSPKLGVRVGAVGDSGLGAMLHLDWTPVSLDNSQILGADIAMHRFRIMAELAVQKHVAPKLIASFRAGLGIDILHESASGTLLGTSFHSSDTDTGFAFELGGGIWYDLGSAQIGGELALPIGHHSKQGNNTDGNYTFDYTAYNIDLLFGVRVMQH